METGLPPAIENCLIGEINRTGGWRLEGVLEEKINGNGQRDNIDGAFWYRDLATLATVLARRFVFGLAGFGGDLGGVINESYSEKGRIGGVGGPTLENLFRSRP